MEPAIGWSAKVTDEIMDRTFWVGVYPGMTDDMIDDMAQVIIEAVTERCGESR